MKKQDEREEDDATKTLVARRLIGPWLACRRLRGNKEKNNERKEKRQFIISHLSIKRMPLPWPCQTLLWDRVANQLAELNVDVFMSGWKKEWMEKWKRSKMSVRRQSSSEKTSTCSCLICPFLVLLHFFPSSSMFLFRSLKHQNLAKFCFK